MFVLKKVLIFTFNLLQYEKDNILQNQDNPCEKFHMVFFFLMCNRLMIANKNRLIMIIGKSDRLVCCLQLWLLPSVVLSSAVMDLFYSREQ